jgi:hypothetical protein
MPENGRPASPSAFLALPAREWPFPGLRLAVALAVLASSYAAADCKLSYGEVEKRKSILIENEKVTVEIIPEWGGKIWGFIPKRTGNDCLDVRGRTGGFSDETFIFSNHYWEPVEYKVEILKNAPEEISVRVTGQRQIPHYEAEIRLERTMTLRKGSALLDIVTEMFNLGPADYDPADLPSPSFPGAQFLYALHPETGIGKDGAKNDLLYIPRKDGIAVMPAANPDRSLTDRPSVDAPDKPMYCPVRGWVGASDTETNDFFFLTFDPKAVIGCQLYLGYSFYNLELVFTPVKLPANGSQKFLFGFTCDVADIKDMDETFAMRDFTVPEYVTPGQPMKTSFDIVSLNAQGGKVKVAQSTTDANGQVIAKLEEEIAVPPQKFLKLEREFQTGQPASYGTRKHVIAVNGKERSSHAVKAIDDTSRGVLQAHAEALTKINKLEAEIQSLKAQQADARLHLMSLQEERALLHKMLRTPGYSLTEMPKPEAQK